MNQTDDWDDEQPTNPTVTRFDTSDTPSGYDWHSLPGEPGSADWARAEASRLVEQAATRIQCPEGEARARAAALVMWERVKDVLVGG